MNTKFVTDHSMMLLTSAGVVSNASAQGKTRAEVHHQLIQTENNGSRIVTVASYSDVAAIHAQQVARLKQQNHNCASPSSSGTSATGPRVASHPGRAKHTWVGPVDFCTPYFGS